MPAAATDYLAEYDNAAEADKFPLVHKWMKQEPLPFFKQLRAMRPVLVTPECTLVTQFTDIRDLLQMPKIFTVDLYKPKMGVTDTDVGYLMAHDDDALHYREKSLMEGMLNREDLPRIRKLVAKTSQEILDAAGENKIEVVNQYCRMVPARLVRDYFGLDGIDLEDLIRWSFWNQYDAFHNQPFDLNPEAKFKEIVDNHNKVSEELVAYITVLMGRKLVKVKIERLFSPLLAPFRMISGLFGRLRGREAEGTKDDIVLRMLRSSFADEVEFPLDRVGVNAGGLLIGAIETTSQAVAQTIAFFLERPDLLKRAKEAAARDDPAAFDAMVWEALRFVPISPYMFRQASSDYTIAKGTDRETRIDAGTNVLLITQSAMFDPYAYEDPEAFNPQRNWYHHFNFGFGSHECLGKYVGMVMIPEMVRHVIRKRDLRSAGPIDYSYGPFPEKFELEWA
ncbi:MAG: cytochrome P450 [Alphaproteobacteria bacterium]|nr:cytochrome P450 [Alphaproteobacteria bacterium]